MALSKTIKLDNGLELNYHVVNIIETTSANSVKVQLDTFTSKEYYKKAMIKNSKIKEQDDLLIKFNELASKDELTKVEQNKLNKIQSKFNEIADEIDKCNDYSDYVLVENIIELHNIEDFSRENIEKELLNTTLFKGAKIVN